MENLFQGLSGVTVCLDDILIARATEAEHLTTLDEVLHRLDSVGLRTKRDKCRFMVPDQLPTLDTELTLKVCIQLLKN